MKSMVNRRWHCVRGMMLVFVVACSAALVEQDIAEPLHREDGAASVYSVYIPMRDGVRIPQQGEPLMTIYRSKDNSFYVELPIVPD